MVVQRPEKKRTQSGFTLIELAIIMAIIAILGAVGAVKFQSMKQEATDAAAASSLANARSALAIAIAKDKDKDGKIDMAELDGYLEGDLTDKVAGTSFTWTVGTTKYTVEYTKSTDGSIDSITSVTAQ